MTPNEIDTLYNDLSQTPQQAANDAIGQLGASQAARGASLAAMGASGGNGIGNYTYNRLVDPTVNQLSSTLVTAGRSKALNQAISIAQQQAQDNYNKAQQNYYNRLRRARSKGGGSSSEGSGGGEAGTIKGVNETPNDGQTISSDTPAEGDRYSTGTDKKTGARWVQKNNKRYYIDNNLYDKYKKNPSGTWSDIAKKGTSSGDYAVYGKLNPSGWDKFHHDVIHNFFSGWGF